MTPDEASRLLDGTTPGPWGVEYDREWAIGISAPEGIVFGPYYDQEEMDQWETGSDADLRLAAAAPTLAALFAGMRTEYRAECQDSRGRWFPAPQCSSCGGGWGTKQQAERNADAWKADGYVTRIVPCYIAEPEEA